MAHESAYFFLSRIGGKHAAKELKRELDALPGVMSVSVNERADTLAVDYDDTGVTLDRLDRRVRELGYAVDALNIDQLTD